MMTAAQSGEMRRDGAQQSSDVAQVAVGGHAPHAHDGAFHHEALLHAGEEQFVAATLPHLRAAIDAEQPILVAVLPGKIEVLTEALGQDARQVRFADMRELGANPARIIPAWQTFLKDVVPSGSSALGIGEPIWSERSAAELTECQRHEELLNAAFEDDIAWRLLCTYDLDALEDGVIEAARCSHPHVTSDGELAQGLREAAMNVLAGSLQEPSDTTLELTFSAAELSGVRRLVAAEAGRAALEQGRAEDLVLAVSELATNSIRHGGGSGRLRLWVDGGVLLCEIGDCGLITDPLVGRIRPEPLQPSGRGLWLVNQVCDLAQIRSSAAEGTRVRVHMRLP